VAFGVGKFPIQMVFFYSLPPQPEAGGTAPHNSEIGRKSTPHGHGAEKIWLRLELYSIRINDQWRIVFGWDTQPFDVRIIDYH
jgi:hypothetical protein